MLMRSINSSNTVSGALRHRRRPKKMMETIKNWFRNRFPARESARTDLRATNSVQVKRLRPPPPQRPAVQNGPDIVEIDPDLQGRIESMGPGKNVLIRNRFVREDSGTHETLKILDDSMVDSGEETGLDPYNTGSFDRSKNWDHRFRK